MTCAAIPLTSKGASPSVPSGLTFNDFGIRPEYEPCFSSSAQAVRVSPLKYIPLDFYRIQHLDLKKSGESSGLHLQNMADFWLASFFRRDVR